MRKSHRANMRRSRLSTEWSVVNAKLGGYNFQHYPICDVIHRYSKIAPYNAPTREWARFRAWMKEQVDGVTPWPN